MIHGDKYDTYNDGYYWGMQEGQTIGYEQGYADAVNDLEPRITKLWVELQTLNARIAYLEKAEKGESNE